MAAPGVGVGDLVNACVFIYDLCMKYKDAPKEFDEIADKAKSTAVVLERIRTEAKLRGNLVERAGPQGYSQLKHHLKGLKADSDKLKVIVAKYDKIHDEGPGRRMLFTVMESGGLTDLRRRIGLHEQMLEMWYMTLIYGSLRRLEGGQRDILKAIEAMKKWSPDKQRSVRQSVLRGDSKPLEEELHKSGMDPISVKSALGAAVEYVDSPPREQVKMETRAKSSTVRQQPEDGGVFGEDAYFDDPSFKFSHAFDESYGGDDHLFPGDSSKIHRRKSTGSRRKSATDDNNYDEDFILLRKGKQASRETPHHKRRESEPHEPRLTTHLSDHEPLLAVPPRHHHRSRSEQKPHIIVPVYDSPQSQPHRSRSRSSRVIVEAGSDMDLAPVESHGRRRRGSSTHSYTREREQEREPGRRRSTSRGSHGGVEGFDRRRLVTKMDRIDSMPVDQS